MHRGFSCAGYALGGGLAAAGLPLGPRSMLPALGAAVYTPERWDVYAIALALSLFLFSAAHAAKLEPVKVEPLSAETVAVTQAMIRKGLSDPENARFGEMIGGRNVQGVLHVCGWVNAKNSFGSDMPFSGIVIERPVGSPNKKAEAFVLMFLGDNVRDRFLTLSVCKVRGLALR